MTYFRNCHKFDDVVYDMENVSKFKLARLQLLAN